MYTIPTKKCSYCPEGEHPITDFYGNGWCKKRNADYQRKRASRLKEEKRRAQVLSGQVSPAAMTDEEFQMWIKTRREQADQVEEQLQGTEGTTEGSGRLYTESKQIPGFHMSEEDIRQLQEGTEGE